MTVLQTTNLTIPITTAATAAFPNGKPLGNTNITTTVTSSGVTVTTQRSIGSSGSSYTYSTAGQAFSISCTGLKPSTQHYFYFSGINGGSQCQPAGGALGGNLYTDASGSINFTFYYNSGITTGSSVTASQSIISSLVGVKAFQLVSADGQSSASSTIRIISQVN